MIEARGLTKKYGEVVALYPLDLRIDRGQIFGYVGPNGAGKTTTIRMLCGLLRPSGGEATVAGLDVVRQPDEVKTAVGYMPDRTVAYEGMRVWEYLDFFGAAYRIPRRQRTRRVDEVLDLTGSREMRDYFVETLSKGMSQRLGIARVLMHDPDVLFLDEPTSGLDPRARVEMRLLLSRLRDIGKTILVSSHILPELSMICDQVGFLEHGRMLACGPVREVLQMVHPNRVMEIETLSDPEEAAGTIRRLRGERPTAVSRVGNLLRVELDADDAEIAGLIAGLVSDGHALLGFREVVADLEQAFLAITAGGAAGKRNPVEIS